MGVAQVIKKDLLTGFIVLLPMSLLVLVIAWLYRVIDNIVEPIAALYSAPNMITKLIVLIILILAVGFIGFAARTKPGVWFFTNLDKHVFCNIPGYKFIKSLIEPFTGSTFKENVESVALVDIFDNGAYMTAFITDKGQKFTTVFVPTGPNPTSGNIYHIPNKRVKPINAKVDDVLGSVVAVGAGSQKLLKKLK